MCWCDLNAESELLAEFIPNSEEVRGSDKPDAKEDALMRFANGALRVLITKPSIAGFGMNWQQCHNMILWGCPTATSKCTKQFAGVTDSGKSGP